MMRFPSGCLGVWRIEENEEKLRTIAGPALCADVSESDSPKRRLEKLAVRALLSEMLRVMGLCSSDAHICYHDDGSPYLQGGPFISISHTDGYAAVILNCENKVGIDVEIRSPRALKLIPRFELQGKSYSDPDSATLCWSAKESLFKLIGKTVSDFRNSMHISPFAPSESGCLEATLTYGEIHECCTVNYRVEEELVLTWIDDGVQ